MPFEGGVPGQTLLNLLKVSRVGRLGITNSDRELQIRSGRDTLRLPLQPSKDFLFEIPTIKARETLPVEPKDFLAAVKLCMRSVSRDISIPERFGLTIIPNEPYLLLYAFNGATITHAKVKAEGLVSWKRVVLSADFCRQMLRIAARDKDINLNVQEEYSLLEASDGTQLFGKLINVSCPLEFPSIVGDHLPGDYVNQLQQIPKRLRLILQRATILAKRKIGTSSVTVKVRNGKMYLTSKSEEGAELNDFTYLRNHKDITVELNPKLLLAGCNLFQRILFTETGAIMAKVDAIYIVVYT
jgi:DNA polymerase III sliding clamp (beta) subunit (PCNA family)